jgi:hypothetical protein
MSLFRLLLYLVLGVMIWRAVRWFARMAQGTRRGNNEEMPIAPPAPTKTQMDLRDIQDAHFEDITPKEEDQEPPPKE